MDAGHRAKSVPQPGQVDAKDLAHAAGALLAHEEVLVVLPGVPVGQVLADVVDVIDRLAGFGHKLLGLRLDVLGLTPVQHGGGEEQRQVLLFGKGDVALVAVVDQVQLGEHRQAGGQQLGDDGGMADRRGADQRGVGLLGGDGLVDGGVSRNAQTGGLGTAAFGAVHTADHGVGAHALDQTGTAFAHAAQTDDEKFHRRFLLLHFFLLFFF